MTNLKSVPPYRHPGSINFKSGPYEAWKALGGGTARPFFPPRLLHALAYRCEWPELWRTRGEARLMFVEPVSVRFDTFPYYLTHEVVPFIWDCWPSHYDRMERWLRRHRVRCAIFTSRQEMEAMQQRLPEVLMLHCPEAVDTARYSAGKPLAARSIDLLEFGRSNAKVLGGVDMTGIRHVSTLQHGRYIFSNEALFQAMGNARITLCLPRSVTHPELAEGVETLTQRYWEAMLSGMLIVGHAPQELVDIVGYNPVIELDVQAPARQIAQLLAHIADYQPMVDRNREVALAKGDWKQRISELMHRLEALGWHCLANTVYDCLQNDATHKAEQ